MPNVARKQKALRPTTSIGWAMPLLVIALGVAFCGCLGLLSRGPAESRAQVPPASNPSNDSSSQPRDVARVRPARPHYQLLTERLAASLASILNESDAMELNHKLNELSAQLETAEIPAALAFLEEHDFSSTGRDLELRLLRRWARTEPRQAADWASQLPAGEGRHEGIVGVALVWADQNFSDAVGWLRQLPEEDERNSGLLLAANEAIRSQPTEALSLAFELPASESREDLIGRAAAEWAVKTPEVAADWANQIADLPLRERVLTQIVATWADSDPSSAAAFALKSLTPGRQQDDAIVAITQRWVQQAPEAAAEWAASFPEGQLRATTLEETIKLWSDQNLEKPGNWLNQLAPGLSRDTAVVAYVSKLAPQFPELAGKWAGIVRDPTLRQQIARISQPVAP